MHQILNSALSGNVSVAKNAIEIPTKLTINDNQITLRFIQPSDAEMEQEFVKKLSPVARRLRFFSGLRELPSYLLDKLTHTIYPKSCALIMTTIVDKKEVEIGVARYEPTNKEQVVEFAVVVADEWQHLGLAHILLNALFDIANKTGIKQIDGTVLRENFQMLKLAQQLNFKIKEVVDDASTVQIIKEL